MLIKKKNKFKTNQVVDYIYNILDLKRYFLLVMGLLIVAVGFNLFLLPNNIVFGGVSGISIVTSKLFGWDTSLFIMICNILLLIISYFTLGFSDTKRSIIGSILFPVFVKITSDINSFANVSNNDIIICILFGAVLHGIGAGLVFKTGFTTGGTDIINQILSKYAKISIGNAIIFSDGIIVLFGAVVFGFTKLLYSLVTLYIISILTDKVMLGISDSKAFYIIAEEEQAIKDYIINELGHGVTVFDARGGYTKEKQKVLFCVIPTKDYFKLKDTIHHIDKDAFFVATDSYEVLGGE